MTSSYIEITPEDSKEGIKLSFKKLSNLIDSADCLKRNNYNDSSIVLSIYALEEISRCKRFLYSIRDKENIKKEIWKEISENHKSKLNRIIKEIYSNKKNELIKGGYPYDKELNIFLSKFELNKKRSEAFSKLLLFLRERILYTDWNDGKWVSIEKYYVPETMERLSKSLLNENRCLQKEIKNEMMSLNI